MSNITWHDHKVTKEVRREQHGHKPCLIWLTGLSGSGKSTLASELEFQLVREYNVHTYLLDGDNVRTRLCNDLGFSEEDRVENIRRVGAVSQLFVDAGLITISAFISPFQRDRDLARAMLQEGEFVEVFVDASLKVCEERDPKGLYKKARAGEIQNFTGIDSPYEAPQIPEVHVQNGIQTPAESVGQIIRFLKEGGYLPKR